MRSILTLILSFIPIFFACKTDPNTQFADKGEAHPVIQQAETGSGQEQAGLAPQSQLSPDEAKEAELNLSALSQGLPYEQKTIKSGQAEQKVAIIGAGASGLAAAHYLKQIGYRHVTVFEKESRSGGKVYSYMIDDKPYEMGAFWAGETYPTVLELAAFYGAKYGKDPIEHYVETAPGKGHPFQNSVLVGLRPLVLPFEMLHLPGFYLRWGKDVRKTGIEGINPDLFLPMEEFAKKYGIPITAEIFEPFWIGCGYEYYKTVPAIYVLKLMMPSMATALKNSFKQLSLNGWKAGLYDFPEGYSSLFDKMAAALPDLRLNQAVTKVKRVTSGGKTVISVTAGGKTEQFDKLIIATDLRIAMRYLDTTSTEKALFGQVRSLKYNSYLIDMNVVKHPKRRVVFFEQYKKAESTGHVVAIGNRYGNSYWNVLQIVSGNISAAEADRRLGEDLDRLSSGPRTIVKKIEWDYFPHVSVEALRAGYYDRMAALQGTKSTFYIGGVMNFETVEGNVSFAKNLVMQRF